MATMDHEGDFPSPAHSDFYQKLRAKMRDWLEGKAGKGHKFAEYLMVAPDLFHLLCKLVVDKDVPAGEKAKLVLVIAYFVSPIDLVPEGVVGPVGYVDDVALSALVLNGMLNKVDPSVVRKHWAGDGDALDVIQNILQVADKMVGSGLWKRLKDLLK